LDLDVLDLDVSRRVYRINFYMIRFNQMIYIIIFEFSRPVAHCTWNLYLIHVTLKTSIRHDLEQNIHISVVK